MIIESELEELTPSSSQGKEPGFASRGAARYADIALLLIFLAAVVILQIASGAYRGEFGAYPDEPAHYVTSLMLRDYVLHGHLTSPMKFAEEYYRHYPKVAFGHWPPLFYVVQSGWMMLFSASRASVRLEIAVTTALLAFSVYREARRWFGWQAGVMAGLLTVCLPLVQTYSDQEMAESLLTLLCFWTAIYFARYAETERRRDALIFGLCFAAAVLTKGSGWLLAMIPPMVMVLSRKLRLLKQANFWLPVGLVALTCVPWQVMTMRMAERGWDGGSSPSVSYTGNALVAFLRLFPSILGPGLLALLMIGLVVQLLIPGLRRLTVTPRVAAMFALLAAVWIFHSVVPAGIEDRKLVLAVPAMILFLIGGGIWLADRIPAKLSIYPWRYAMITTLGAASFLLTTFSVPRIDHYGFIEAARYLTHRSDLRNATVLVSSESGGEGMLVSEVAMDEPRPRDTIIRATKALATVAWNGIDYHSTYSDPAQIREYLRANHVQIVVMDTFAPQIRFAHNSLLRQAVTDYREYELVATFPGQGSEAAGQVQIYRVRS